MSIIAMRMVCKYHRDNNGTRIRMVCKYHQDNNGTCMRMVCKYHRDNNGTCILSSNNSQCISMVII